MVRDVRCAEDLGPHSVSVLYSSCPYYLFFSLCAVRLLCVLQGSTMASYYGHDLTAQTGMVLLRIVSCPWFVALCSSCSPLLRLSYHRLSISLAVLSLTQLHVLLYTGTVTSVLPEPRVTRADPGPDTWHLPCCDYILHVLQISLVAPPCLFRAVAPKPCDV